MQVHRVLIVASAWLTVAGCRQLERPAAHPHDVALRIGLGSTTGSQSAPVADLLTQEGLVNLSPEGRPVPWLAQSWAASADRLTWTFRLRPGVVFHDGTPLTAAVVRDALTKLLPDSLGSFYSNVKEIRARSDTDLAIVLQRPSALLIEALNVLIHPRDSRAGTGPFAQVPGSRAGAVELRANDMYYGGRSSIDRIIIHSYPSNRSAWADLLRDQLDMVYEVGTTGSEVIRASAETKLYTFRRPYAHVIVLNVARPSLRGADIRRALNAAIDRDELVAVALQGHGRPADSPIWPDHWASDPTLPRFQYKPTSLADRRLHITCLYSDPADERTLLFVQRQLRDVGVEVDLELVSVPDGLARAARGEFDAWFVDMGLGPSLIRQQFFWGQGSPYNLGHYDSGAVASALEALEDSDGDEGYKAAVAALQRAIVDDPPGIFLAWTERARAVSSRFDVHQEPGRDIFTTLRLWRPSSGADAPN